jgi:hypothetical protein
LSCFIQGLGLIDYNQKEEQSLTQSRSTMKNKVQQEGILIEMTFENKVNCGLMNLLNNFAREPKEKQSKTSDNHQTNKGRRKGLTFSLPLMEFLY